MSTLKASVIVLAWNGRDYLGPCLDAVLAQDYADREVIVVDNGSTDGSAGFVAENYPQVRLIRNERNLGFAAGNNVGLRAATGDLLVLLNQDTEVHDGWLAALSQAFDDPATGIVGCKLLYPDGTIQHAGGTVYGAVGESDHVGRHGLADDPQFNELTDVEFVTGAALAISRTVVERIGLLDEGFAPAYYEDVDWCYRARAAGFCVVYQPQAVVTHHESTTIDPTSHELKFALQQGRLRFLFKHRSLDQLLDEFGPAERERLAAMNRDENLMAARRTYLHTILALPGILAFRGSSQKEVEALVDLLSDLRAKTLAGLKDLLVNPSLAPFTTEPLLDLDFARHVKGERARLLRTLEESQEIVEQPFTSEVPVLGKFIVAVRSLWNSIATKWYVRPLIHQQSVFNSYVAVYLRLLQEQIDILEPRSIEHGHILRGQLLDVEENIREINALAEHLTSMGGPNNHRPKS